MKKAIAVIWLFLAILPALSIADELFIICQPESFVYARKTPKMDGSPSGRYELGDKIETDGKRKNGFVHVVNAGFESDEVWVYSGFVTGELTIRTVRATARKSKVICRRCIKGKKRAMLSKGDAVEVFAWSDDWAVTDHGYVRTKYLEVGNEE